MGRLNGIVVYAAFFAVALGAGASARAEVAVAIEGPQSAALTKKLGRGVGGAVAGPRLTKAAREAGFKSLGLSDAKGPKAKKVGAVAQKLGVSAVLLGRTKSSRTKLSLQWVVLSAGGGEVLGKGNQPVGSVKGKGRKKRVVWKLDGLLGSLSKALNQNPGEGAVAESPEPAPEGGGGGEVATDEPDPFGELPDWTEGGDGPTNSNATSEKATADDEPEVAKEVERPSTPREGFVDAILVVGASGGVAGRNVSHRGVGTPNIRPYSLGAAAQIRIDAMGFPLFALEVPFLSTLGVQASFSRAFGITTEASDVAGLTLDNTWMQWRVGVVERIKLKPAALDISLSFGSEEFSFDGNQGAVGTDAVPAVEYLYLRVGVDGYLDADPIIVGLGAAYRAPLSAGPMDDFFPRNKVHGLDAQLSVGYRLVAGLQLVLFGTYEQYFFKLGSQPGDTYVAEKTSDRMYSGQLGVRYAL